MAQLFFEDGALQSAVARSCTDKPLVESLSLQVLNLSQVAWVRHTLNGWHAQNDCLQSDAIATRCPLTTIKLHEDKWFICSKTESITVYQRYCKDPADVDACNAYFGNFSFDIERGFCSKDETITLRTATSIRRRLRPQRPCRAAAARPVAAAARAPAAPRSQNTR